MITQRQLADMLSVSPQMISRWKLGRCGLSVSTAIRWAAILNIEFRTLITAPPDPKIRARLLGLKKKGGGN